MFARRASGRMNRRGIGAGGGVDATALDYVAASAVIAYHRADLGITLNGSNVSAWADQSGNGHDFAQATAANQPPYNATHAPNNRPALDSDGTNHFMSNGTMVLPAPGTTPTCVWIIAHQHSWTNNDTLISSPGGSFNAGLSIIQVVASPQIRQSNEGTGNLVVDWTLNDWKRVIALFTGSTSDRLKVGATNVTGTSALNAGPFTGRYIFGRSSGFRWDGALAEVLHTNRALTAQEESNLDAYALARYGASLGI